MRCWRRTCGAWKRGAEGTGCRACTHAGGPHGHGLCGACTRQWLASWAHVVAHAAIGGTIARRSPTRAHGRQVAGVALLAAPQLCPPRPRYQHYLENVLEVADEYQEVGDLLLRHATLLATNQDLKEHQRKCAELAEKIRTELQVGV